MMNKEEINKLTISEFSFESFSVKETHITYKAPLNKELNLSILPKGTIDRKKKRFLLEMKVLITDTDNNFNVEIVIEGIFNFKEEIEKSLLDSYFYLNAPAILFPYIRTYIYTLTSLGGFGSVHLPIMNLSSVIDLKVNTIEI